MVKKARWREVILIGIAAITAVFSFYPTGDDSMLNSNRTRKRPAVAATITASTVKEGADIASDDTMDPFAPRGWQPPSPAPAATPIAAAAVPVVPAAPPAPAEPPPLPYKFMGAMNEDGNLSIYLSRGDQAVVARSGETLDGTYKVVAIDSQHIEFEHLPTGEKQSLSIPASEN